LFGLSQGHGMPAGGRSQLSARLIDVLHFEYHTEPLIPITRVLFVEQFLHLLEVREGGL
jgi:hypothetical protein